MLFWLVAILVFVADQLTKAFVASHFMADESRIVIPRLLYWTYVQNRHGAFGLFGSSPFLLVGMAVVVLAVFWFSFRDLAARSWVVRIAFGAIVGGAIGNIVDRFHYGFVVDFIDLRWWPVFNVADSCITVGVGLLVLATFLRERGLARNGSHDPG
ncbi:MAG: signal peptidase II [Vulcanimicrobiaceae bacterium]